MLQAQWFFSLGAEGKPFNFQTPPLYQIIIAILFKFFQVNDLYMFLLSIIFSCLAIYIFFYLVKMLYAEDIALYAVIFFILSEFFLFFSKSGLGDAAFLFFFITSFYFFLKGTKSNRIEDFLLAGIFVTLCLYTKYSAPAFLIIFFLIGLLNKKKSTVPWLLFSIVLPTLLYLPYLYMFVKFITLPGISERHGSILGLNHLRFIYYLFAFSPVPFILTILFLPRLSKLDYPIFTPILVFLIILGFYYPYFRLLYPIIPFLAIFAAKFIVQTKKLKPYLLTGAVIISIICGFRTITYYSNIPKKIAQICDQYVSDEGAKYIYTITPPNIYFYIEGEILIPSNHAIVKLGKRFPQLLKSRIIFYEDNNLLSQEEKTMLIHATIFDALKRDNISLYTKGKLLDSIEFIDAPVYYKDIFNPLRNKRQIYQFFIFENKKLGNALDTLWHLGFNPKVQLILKE